MIEAPLSLQQSQSSKPQSQSSTQQSGLTIPPSHLSACAAQGIPTQGNAAGNTDDVFDLQGANKDPGPLPAGFTWRGIVALVGSVVSGLLGVGTIAWYGAGEIGTQKPGKKTEAVIAVVEGEGEGEKEEAK